MPRMIFSTNYAFTALFNCGCVVTWGGARIPDAIQDQLENVKMIFSNVGAFVALLENGSVFSWGALSYGGQIPDENQIDIRNDENKGKKTYRAYISLTLSALLYGVVWITFKFVYDHGDVSAPKAMFISNVVHFCIVLLCVLKWKITLIPSEWKKIKLLILLTILNGIGMGGRMFSISFAPVGDLSAIFSLTPVATGLFTCLVLRKPLQKSYPILLMTAIFGTMFIIQPQFLFGEDEQFTTSGLDQKYIGYGIAFGSVFVNVLWYSNIKPIVHFFTFSFWSRAFIICFAFLMMVLSEDVDLFHFTLQQWLLLLLCGVLNFAAYNLATFGSQFADSPNTPPLILLLEIPVVYVAQASILNVKSDWKKYLGVGSTICSVIGYILTKKNNVKTDKIPSKLMNVKTIFPHTNQFTALFYNNRPMLTWP